ncbi:MAG: polysaccharide deacetylase family protein [Thermoplasmata archaeon]
MKPRIVVTIDLERDFPNGLHGSFLGITEGLPNLLGVLEELDVLSDFFVSLEVAERFGSTIRDLKARGHYLGNHGSQHGYLCTKDAKAQHEDISESTEVMTELLSSRPVFFRAPQFGADGNTILALEDLGYQVDSSVLPGRLVRQRFLGKVLDFTDAPLGVYHPSHEDITKEGQSPIVEIPLTENVLRRGTPLGMGFVNSEGAEAAIAASRAHKGEYVTFLIHPWECIDIVESFPHLPKYLVNECSSDMSDFRRMLKGLLDLGDFTNLVHLANEHRGVKTE